MPTLTVDQPTLDKLERLASDRGVTVGEWLARSLETGVPEEERAEREPPAARDRVATRRAESIEEWLHRIAARHRGVSGFVDDSRDSIYEPPRGL